MEHLKKKRKQIYGDIRLVMSDFLHKTMTYKMLGGILARDHTFLFPLDWKFPDSSEKIHIFVRELRRVENWTYPLEIMEKDPICSETPAVLYLQGGPGFPSPRPSSPPGGWMDSALKKGYRVFLLDQRGTGNSTSMTPQRLDCLFERGGIELQLHYLTNMRADAIAADVEAIRVALCGTNKLSLLGQSYGGFCMLSFMSFYKNSVGKCLFTCGLAPILQPVSEVYRATYRRMLTRNRRFYKKYPMDIARVKAIVSYLSSQESSHVKLPNGGHLTVRRFLQLGILLGSATGMETLHWILESAFFNSGEFSSSDPVILSEEFLYSIQDHQAGFESNPIYWFLHESIYMNGGRSRSEWTAESVMKENEFVEKFDPFLCLNDDSKQINFTGEMVYSWMSDDYARLRPYKELGNMLASTEWDRPLYDFKVLENLSTVIPCAALVSYDDVYVERAFSEGTANLLGGEDACKLWITNEFQHSGLRDQPSVVFDKLHSMTTGECSLPS